MDSLLEPEFAPAYSAWKANPDPTATDEVIKAVNPVIDSAMRTYAGGLTSPTLRSKAKMIVIDSLPRYDENRAKLRTHLMTQLQGLRRHAARESQPINIPERVALDMHKVWSAENELSDRLGRTPSDAELMSHTGLSRKRLTHIRKAKPTIVEGLTRPPEDHIDESAGASGPAVVSNDDDAWLNFIYQDLTGVDQVIMEHVLGMHGKKVLPKSRIASKLRLTPGAISQRLAKIQKLIDARPGYETRVL